MDKSESHVQLGVRIPESWIGRLDKLAERLSKPGMTVTRSEALRMAAHRGLEILEKSK